MKNICSDSDAKMTLGRDVIPHGKKGFYSMGLRGLPETMEIVYQ